MRDIVDRLKNDGSSWAQSMFNEAAAEIERLRLAADALTEERTRWRADNSKLEADNDRLRAALKPFAEMADEWKDEPDSLEVELKAYDAPCPGMAVATFRAAKHALEQNAGAVDG